MKTHARKLSPQEQREKRATALRMREQGYTYKAIGEAVGVHPRTIAHWAQVAEHKGEKAAIAGGQRGVRGVGRHVGKLGARRSPGCVGCC